ncbi:hypothetical protein F9L07_19575 [Pimelobacter simplex]|uniref:Uncharacterized protein n=1 Tax=Nocardioides simplex TaxID=2045 RepID=A0A7J5DV95_NOCSI|nr:hypothetical protein [Pimelobacter simplex]KAB2809243.1 hypothetical protein F9L07_19575 [Pimelobacter simplex]
MTAASNSEARPTSETQDLLAALQRSINEAKAPRDDTQAAGIAASVPTAQEPTPTLGDAPGADSEALAALLDQIACAIRDEWEPGGRMEWAEQHARSALGAVLGSSWLADHDRQIAAVAWDDGYQDGRRQDAEGDDGPRFVNPYSKEARRG